MEQLTSSNRDGRKGRLTTWAPFFQTQPRTLCLEKIPMLWRFEKQLSDYQSEWSKGGDKYYSHSKSPTHHKKYWAVGLQQNSVLLGFSSEHQLTHRREIIRGENAERKIGKVPGKLKPQALSFPKIGVWTSSYNKASSGYGMGPPKKALCQDPANTSQNWVQAEQFFGWEWCSHEMWKSELQTCWVEMPGWPWCCWSWQSVCNRTRGSPPAAEMRVNGSITGGRS